MFFGHIFDIFDIWIYFINYCQGWVKYPDNVETPVLVSLSVCCQLIDQDGNATQFLDDSNRFYTLIPHDFGMKKPPLLDTADTIRVRVDLRVLMFLLLF